MYSILLLEDDLLFASSIEDFLVCEGIRRDLERLNNLRNSIY